MQLSTWSLGKPPYIPQCGLAKAGRALHLKGGGGLLFNAIPPWLEGLEASLLTKAVVLNL
jgi:hypothetical protein